MKLLRPASSTGQFLEDASLRHAGQSPPRDESHFIPLDEPKGGLPAAALAAGSRLTQRSSDQVLPVTSDGGRGRLAHLSLALPVREAQ